MNRINDVKKRLVEILSQNGPYACWEDLERECYASDDFITSTSVVPEAARQLIQDKLITYSNRTYRLTPLNIARLRKQGLV